MIEDPKKLHGAEKTPLGLIPTVAMDVMSAVLKHGADKYGEANWRTAPIAISTYTSAFFRHLNAWRDGEDLDPDSGVSHLGHVMAACAIILDSARAGTLVDARRPL
jgi:hypothetical protein